MTDLNALCYDNELFAFLKTKSLDVLPIDTKRIFFLIGKKMAGLFPDLVRRLRTPKRIQIAITLYISTLCLHLSQTNNPKLSLFLAEKGVSIFGDLTTATDHLTESDAIEIAAEKVMVGRILNSEYLVQIANASKILSIVFLNSPPYTEEHFIDICYLLCHSIWKYTEKYNTDDFLVLHDSLAASFKMKGKDFITLLKIGMSLDKSTSVLYSNETKIHGLIRDLEKPPQDEDTCFKDKMCRINNSID